MRQADKKVSSRMNRLMDRRKGREKERDDNKNLTDEFADM
jgi:hypothetical protein